MISLANSASRVPKWRKYFSYVQVFFFPCFFFKERSFVPSNLDQRHIPKINGLFTSIGLDPLQGFNTFHGLTPAPLFISSSYTPHLALCCRTMMSYLKLPERITLFCLPRTPSPTRALLPCHSLLRAPSALCFRTYTTYFDFCMMVEEEGRESLLLLAHHCKPGT